MSRGRGGIQRAALVVAMLVLVAACGARVSDEQVASLRSTGSGDGTAQPLASTSPDGATAEATTDTVAGQPVGPASASGGAAGEASAAAPSGGNGGATDVGVTGTEVLLGQVVTMSGPIPGLFSGAVTGAQAVIAYQNSKGGLFGRRFRLDSRDDQFDSGTNRAQTTEQVGKVFAVLGSFSLFDDAAVDAVGKSGIPDLSVPINESRQKIPNNLSIAPIDMGGGPTGSFEWLSEKFPDAVSAVGSLYGDVAASKAQHQRMQKVAESVGWKFAYTRGYQATETDFTADIIRMKSNGVKAVWLFATDDKSTARIAKAMAQQSFKPAFMVSNYGPSIPALAGEAAEGWYGIATQSLFASPEEAAISPEVKLFQEWMNKVKPGVKLDLYAVYSWSMGRMLFEAMEKAGPKLTRPAVIDAIRKLGDYSAGDIVGPSNPGAKRPTNCFIIAQIRGDRYHRANPAKGFDCRGRYMRF